MSSTYYALILLYPFCSAILALVLVREGSIFRTILNEFYLWIGATILFCGVYLLLLSGVKHTNLLLVFIVYTIYYFAISILRKTTFTESVDIFESQK